MKKRAEIFIHIISFIVFGAVIITKSNQSDYFLYYTIALCLGVGTLFAITRYIASKALKNKKILVFILFLIGGICISFLPASYFYAKFQSDIAGVDFSSSLMFHPIVFKEIFPYAVFTIAVGFLHMIRVKSVLTRKISIYGSVIILITIIGFTTKYYMDTSFQGNDSIYFMDEEYKSLTSILAEKRFKNKVVYIDLWYSSCAPCIKEFKKLPSIKRKLDSNKVEFLYLARETSHPNSLQLWKNSIQKYDLKGSHIYMTDRLRENVWQLIESNNDDTFRAYPHYLLVDKSGKIISYNAKKPSDGKSLIEDINRLVKE